MLVSALLIAGTQVLLERPRWQMFPAYILASLLFLAWLLQNIAPMDLLKEQRGNNRLVTGLLLIGLVALGLAVSIALPIMIPVFRFPHPTRPYTIGTLSYHLVGHVQWDLPLTGMTVVS